MAAYCLFMEDNREFMSRMKSKEPDLILKMVKTVISAIKRKRKSIDIFEITFRDESILIFSISKDQYLECLDNCLNELINIDTSESYLLCAEIIKIKEKPKRISYKKPIVDSEKEIDVSN